MVKTPPLKEITDEQISLIQTEWDFVRSQSVEILYNFFDKFPGNQKQFKAFAGKDLEELKETPEFAQQATLIVDAFSSVVDLLGKDLQGIKDILNKLGSSHREKGINKFAFLEFREAFMEFLRFNAGGTLEGQTAWNDFLDLIFHVIFNNLDGITV